MAARLKVFVTSDGLTDYVVAVSSRAKALAAWGVRQDVFKEGQAREADDPALVKAALAQPGEVLRKPTGAGGKLAKLKRPKAAAPSGPSKAQLKRVANLGAKLAAEDEAHERALARIAADRAALDDKERALGDRHSARREKLRAALSAAKQAPA